MNISIQQALFLSFLKKTDLKKVIEISYLIMVLIKMGLLIFLGFIQYGLVWKYGIILQISTCNWMQNCI